MDVLEFIDTEMIDIGLFIDDLDDLEEWSESEYIKTNSSLDNSNKFKKII